MKRGKKLGFDLDFIGRIMFFFGVLRLLPVPFVGTSIKCSMHQGCCCAGELFDPLLPHLPLEHWLVGHDFLCFLGSAFETKTIIRRV